jgi:hypothetical protein
MNTTKTMMCSCTHKSQDELYGQSVRLFNWANKKEVWRCTVCGSEKKSNKTGGRV